MDNIKVWNAETFNYDDVRVGDHVTQEVVDNAMDCLPPACMRSNCSQVGEPYSHRFHPVTGKLRPVFATFKKVSGQWPNAIWQYCGYCFLGENVETGEDPVYVKGVM